MMHPLITVLASVVIVAPSADPGNFYSLWDLQASAKAYDKIAHGSRSADLQGFLDEDAYGV